MAEPITNAVFTPEQLRLVLPSIADLPLRDQRETMERPFFSLSKRRLKPIDYLSPDGKVHVHVSANPNYGMATIWDADILIYLASVVTELKNRGVNDIPQTIQIRPADLLRRIGRATSGNMYQLLLDALNRLQSTTVRTNIRAGRRKETVFSWIDSYSHIVDEETETNHGMSITMARWFYEGVIMEGGVLGLDPEYFSISGGRERWLYRVARKHAGGAGPGGFSISFPTLFEKSGSEGTYRRFKFELLKIVEANGIPGYRFEVRRGTAGTEPTLVMIRSDDKGRPTQPRPRPVREKAAAPSDEKPRIRAALIEELRRDCPGWDYDQLEIDFATYVAGDPARMPANYERAFAGWVRRKHEREKHTLNLF